MRETNFLLLKFIYDLQLIGDVYLVVIGLRRLETSVRKLEFREFWECLVRCAIIAFKTLTTISTEDKVKGMFLYIWRHVQGVVQEQVNKGKCSVANAQNTSKGNIVRGTQLLNEKFLNLWSKDGHRDYLDAPVGFIVVYIS